MVDGRALSFEVFGLDRDVLIMVDRETGSIWNHLDGEAVRGPLAGSRLKMVPVPQMTWGEWKAEHPGAEVLSPDTPFSSRYRPVSIGRFNPREARFGDDRLEANSLVVGVEIDGSFKGYPIDRLTEAGGVVNDALPGAELVVFYDFTGRTGLAYSRLVDGRPLTFYNASQNGLELRDRETDSVWNSHGSATEGPLAGAALEFVPSFISEWYGWSGYHPETALFE